MTSERIYDKDLYLSAFMALLSMMPDEIRTEVSKDILNEIPKAIDKDADAFMQIIKNHDPKLDKRWYDKEENLRSVVEAMKKLDDKQRAVLYESIDNIINSHL